MPLTDKELFANLVTQRGYQTEAWETVIREARKLAQMKAHGVYEDRGSTIAVDDRRRKDMIEHFRDNLLRAIDFAYAEDARLGATISSITKG